MPLSLKQTRFIEAYLAEPNATKAAISAGYAASAARSHGSRLLRHPDVAAAIEAARAAAERRANDNAERSVVTKDRIIEELGRIAFVDIRRAISFGPGGVVIRPDQDMGPETSAAIADITESRQGRETRVALKMHSKMQALALLARIHGLLDRREPDSENDAGADIADDEDPPVQHAEAEDKKGASAG